MGNRSGLSAKKRTELEALFKKKGYKDFRWIEPEKIVVSQWVRMKCTFGCPQYGRNASCPPNLPSVAECERFFREYDAAVLFHFEKRVEKPEDRHAWSRKVNLRLAKLEREVFLAGYEKAFLLAMDSCHICTDCSAQRERCKEPRSSRPSPEGMAVDVYKTVKQFGYPISPLTDYSQAMNRYAFLLVA